MIEYSLQSWQNIQASTFLILYYEDFLLCIRNYYSSIDRHNGFLKTKEMKEKKNTNILHLNNIYINQPLCTIETKYIICMIRLNGCLNNIL